MTVAEATKKVLFVCPGGLELTLVVQSEDFTVIEGHAIKVRPHRIHFRKMPFGGAYRGEFLTSNPTEIDFIRNHEWFRQGQPPTLEDKITLDGNGQVVVTQGVGFGTSRAIYEAEYNPEAKREGPSIVHRRGDPIEPVEHEPQPVETAPKPLKSKVGRGLKKA